MNVVLGFTLQSGRSAPAAYEEQPVSAAKGVPTGEVRCKIQERQGTWSRKYVLHPPLLGRKHGHH